MNVFLFWSKNQEVLECGEWWVYFLESLHWRYLWDIHVVLQAVECLVFQKRYLGRVGSGNHQQAFANGSHGKGKNFSESTHKMRRWLRTVDTMQWRDFRRELSPDWKVKVTQSCPTLCDPMDCSPPGSSVHGILQARILEWVAMPSSRACSWPRYGTWVSCIAGRFLTVWATREASFPDYPDYPYPKLMIFWLDHKQLLYKFLSSWVSQKHLFSKCLIPYLVSSSGYSSVSQTDTVPVLGA